MVDLRNGRSFFTHLLSTAERTRFIDEVFVVTGHESHKVERLIRRKENPLEATAIYNPFYEVAGPLVSLWMGRQHMVHQNFLVCNGDTFYGSRPFKEIWTHEREAIRLCVDRERVPGADDMKIELDREGHLVQVGKHVSLRRTDAVSTGLLMVKGPETRRAFTKAVDDLIHQNENVQTWQAWHIILNRLADDGIPIETPVVTSNDWVEVDTPDELDHLRSRVNGNVVLKRAVAAD